MGDRMPGVMMKDAMYTQEQLNSEDNNMKTFHCVLINKQGFQEENFYREGESEQQVLDDLAMFQWPKGNWRITEYDSEDE